jgi:hypothetical protein
MWISLVAMPLLLSLGMVLRSHSVQAFEFSVTVTRRTKLARCRMDGSLVTAANRFLANLNNDIDTVADPSGTIVPAVAAAASTISPQPRPKRGFKQRKTHQHTVPVDPNLDWERFEFSESPKWDRRFDADTILVSQNHSATLTHSTDGHNNNNSNTSDDSLVLSKQEALERLVQTEAAHDVEYTQSLQQRLAVWDQLDPTVVQRAIHVIMPCVNPDRVAKIHRVLSQRTRHTRFLFESTLCAHVAK